MGTRTATTDVRVMVKSTIKHQLDDGWVSSVQTGGWVIRDRLQTGIEAEQANRGWQYDGSLTSGNTVDIDLYDYAGLDIGGGVGRDGLGQVMQLLEIVTLIIEHNSGAGSLEVMPTTPANEATWVPTLTVANGGALKAGGTITLYQPDTDAFPITDASSHILRLGANGGDVSYRLFIAGRHDVEASTSSTSSKSTTSKSTSSTSSSLSSSTSCSSTLSMSSTSTISVSSSSTSSTLVTASSLSSSTSTLSSSTSSSQTSLSISSTSLSGTASTSTLLMPSSSTSSTSSSLSYSVSSSTSSIPEEMALVEAWLVNVETRAAQWIAEYPPPRGGVTGTLYQSQANYDAVYCFWQAHNYLASRDPSLAADCLAYAIAHMDPEIYETSINPTYPNPREGSLMSPPDPITWEWWNGPAGHANYNLGPHQIALETSLSEATREDYRFITVNYARQSAGSSPIGSTGVLRSIALGDGTWPSATNFGDDPAVPTACREYALMLVSHMVADDWYSEFEDRVWQGYTLVYGHEECMTRIVERYFLAPGAAVDAWRTITADLAAAGGDFTQVPNTWSENLYEYVPFMFAHSMRALIYAYEDPVFTDAFNADILQAVCDLCDACIAWWQDTLPSGNVFLRYRYYSPGTWAYEGEADLCLFEMPMFAWAWSKTGTQSYYDMCMALTKTGNEEAQWYKPQKWFNQQTLWAYHGFQWLGWVAEPFVVDWRT